VLSYWYLNISRQSAALVNGMLGVNLVGYVGAANKMNRRAIGRLAGKQLIVEVTL